MGCYVTLSEDSFFLKRIFFSTPPGALDHLTPAEVSFAEDWAKAKIDGCLGKSFPCLPDTPLMIQEIALDFASWKLRKMVLAGNAPNEDEHTEGLLERAEGWLADLSRGRCGLLLTDDTFDPDFLPPAPDEQDADRRFYTQVNEDFQRMDHLNDEEKPETDKFTEVDYSDSSTSRGSTEES